jgi:hypothetical protein
MHTVLASVKEFIWEIIDDDRFWIGYGLGGISLLFVIAIIGILLNVI